MSQCQLCGNHFYVPLSLGFLLSFRKYQEPTLCPKCRHKFLRIKSPICQYCGRSGRFQHQICGDCRRWLKAKTAWFRNRALYRYNQAMSDYMKEYKFKGNYRLRLVFQAKFSLKLKQTNCQVVPIPINPETYQKRGFNQVKGLIRSVPILDILKTRCRRKRKSQSAKTRIERLRLPQPFELVPGAKNKIMGKNLVIADDVYTTGTTIRHAASLLKNYGARSVRGITLAR